MPCKKSKRMADGGFSWPMPEPRKLRSSCWPANAKYGLGDAGKPVAQTAHSRRQRQLRPLLLARLPAASASGWMFGKVIDSANRRNEELNRVSRYARGGIMPVIGADPVRLTASPPLLPGRRFACRMEKAQRSCRPRR